MMMELPSSAPVPISRRRVAQRRSEPRLQEARRTSTPNKSSSDAERARRARSGSAATGCEPLVRSTKHDTPSCRVIGSSRSDGSGSARVRRLRLGEACPGSSSSGFRQAPVAGAAVEAARGGALDNGGGRPRNCESILKNDSFLADGRPGAGTREDGGRVAIATGEVLIPALRTTALAVAHISREGGP